MFGKVKNLIKLKKHRKEWRKNNKNNSTYAETLFVRENISVGDYTYGPLFVEHYYSKAKLTIGKYCSISKGVKFLLGGNHGTDAITTYPFGPRIYNKLVESPRWGVDITIEDDVWLGYESLILPGVTIGRGSVVGARSIVTKDVPPYSVYAGTRVVKRRFSENIINRLLKIDYNKIKHTQKDSFEEVWNKALTEENIEDIIGKFTES